MPQTDILNPTPTHPLNPDYGFQKKRPLTHLNAKANQGSPYFREITDTGHQFSLSWNDKLADHARKLKWYYEQYRDGFFTLIDHEGGGRHYVGRFSQPVEPSPTGHNRWSVQQVLFDEIPLAPMLVYPNDWNNDAVWRLLIDDFGNRTVAMIAGSWELTTAAAFFGSGVSKSGSILVALAPVTADQLSYVYAGYGFQFWAATSTGGGKANILLDGTAIGVVDFYSAAGSGGNSQMLFQAQNVQLGIHTVTLQPTGTADSGSSGTSVWWDALKVMR
jgi:hypothetical protein